ncbi:MAG TPA: diguanylate cyclase [Gemmatimonadales bacterium]|nr:diguanylate cyclase [Gemmatimonadales bacterium]
MRPTDLLEFLKHSGRDPSRLVFEDELTGIHNRRFLQSYLEHKVRWQTGSDYPLSVLMLDLDRFKEVNDTFGHGAGDQHLAWVASVLREVVGENGLPTRFGGDEFVVLLPSTDRKAALTMATRLLERLRERPFRLRESGTLIPVSVSIGVATAPNDATTAAELLQASDRALYSAKRSGRDRTASANEVDPHQVFPRTALQRLLVTGIAGRDEELRTVSETLLALGRGQSQFLLFEGAEGMGKTTLLAAIARSLAGHKTFAMTQVACDPHEKYRPYYLATRIVAALLKQRPDQGATIIQSLTPEQLTDLGHLMPATGAGSPALADADERLRRRRIFNTLAKFLQQVVDRRPLVLTVDDLQFADEATLLLLSALLQGDELNLLVCGTTDEPSAATQDAASSATPIEQLFATGAPGLRRLKLGPLSQGHIGDYLGGVFPSLRMPAGFVAELMTITKGNPLFLGEIVRKLVTDGKVRLVGPEWVIEPLPAGYMPQSLKDLLKERFAALDDESRRLLEHAAALGERVPVSMLAGSAAVDENRVLASMDRAEALGLVRTDFNADDNVLRFLGKRVMDVSYAGMDEGRRATVHERVAAHQEGLHQQHALSSPAVLAHHFGQAANPAKADRYQKAARAYAQSVFDAGEAARYALEVSEDEEDQEARLAPEAFALIPKAVRTFMTAARSVQLYPSDSKKTVRALEELRDALDKILLTNRWLTLSRDRDRLRANGRSIDVSQWSGLAASFSQLLDRFELRSLTFEPKVTEGELRQLLTTLANTKPETVAPGFWKRIAVEQRFEHVRPEQVRYSQVVRIGPGGPKPLPKQEGKLSNEELAGIPRVLRVLQTAAKVVKLYPADAKPVTEVVEQLHAAVRQTLRSQDTLTLARAGRTLLANGVRVDMESDAGAKHVLELFDSVGLESVTLRADVPVSELAAFMSALRNVPTGSDRQYWEAFGGNQAHSGLEVNQRRYAVSALQGILHEAQVEAEPAEPVARDAAAAELVASPLAKLQQGLPEFGKELVVTGEHGLLRGLLRRLFERFTEQDVGDRVRTVKACRDLYGRLIFAMRQTFAAAAAEFLVAALATEREPQVLRELGELLRTMAAGAVQFADYQLASRVLLAVTTRQQQLRDAGPALAMLDGQMEPAALRLLDEDFRSGQPERVEQAAKVFGALGKAAIEPLIDVIKSENELRVRQLAARLVADAGPGGPEQMKRAVVTEVIVEKRARLLEVIDTVTPDLRAELGQCLHDASPRVRRAAFQLFERLRRDDLIDLVLPLTRHGQPAVARAAIRALAPLRTYASVEALSKTLATTADPRLAALCCQALGRSEHPAAIDALVGVLKARRFVFFGRRWGLDVQATAAAALHQIPDRRAAKMLARFAQRDRFVWLRAAPDMRVADDLTDPGDATDLHEMSDADRSRGELEQRDRAY